MRIYKNKEIKTLNLAKKNTAEILCEGLLGSNIPLHKLRNPAFIKMFDRLRIDLPCETRIREEVNDKYETFIKSMISRFSKKCFYMIVDESQFHSRKFVNVILGELETPKNYFLVEVKEIFEPANNRIISIIIDDVVKKFNLERELFYLLISDSARYMTLCAKNLKPFYQNLLHITCFVHALHNCAFKVKSKYHNVDFLIASIKGLVVKNYDRKQQFERIGKIPEPIVTRWGSWLNAALYYSLNFNEIFQITDSIENDNSIHLSNAKNAIHNAEVKNELMDIDQKYSPLSDYLDKSISENFTLADAMKLLNKMVFKDDELNLKQFMVDKMKKSDFYRCFDSNLSPFLKSCLQNCPATSIVVERSFSLLQKILVKERRFNSENICKYAVFYFNCKFLSKDCE